MESSTHVLIGEAEEVDAVIVFATIAVALVTMGIMILVAKGLLKRVVDEEERPGLDGWLTVSLLPDEDGGPLTSKAQLLIMLVSGGG